MFLFTAGQIAIDPASGQVVTGDVVAQSERVLANLQAVLAAAGATWNAVVKTTVYLHDMADFPRMNEVILEQRLAGVRRDGGEASMKVIVDWLCEKHGVLAVWRIPRTAVRQLRAAEEARR